MMRATGPRATPWCKGRQAAGLQLQFDLRAVLGKSDCRRSGRWRCEDDHDDVIPGALSEPRRFLVAERAQPHFDEIARARKRSVDRAECSLVGLRCARDLIAGSAGTLGGYGRDKTRSCHETGGTYVPPPARIATAILLASAAPPGDPGPLGPLSRIEIIPRTPGKRGPKAG